MENIIAAFLSDINSVQKDRHLMGKKKKFLFVLQRFISFIVLFFQCAVLPEIVLSTHERELSEVIRLLLKCGYKNDSILSALLHIKQKYNHNDYNYSFGNQKMIKKDVHLLLCKAGSGGMAVGKEQREVEAEII